MNTKQTEQSELQAAADGLRKTYGQPGAGPGFKIGHPRVGGRKPGSQNKRTKMALEICQELNFHPAAFLATIALTGLMPNPDGTATPVTTDDRLRAALGLAPFVMPKLAQTTLSGNDGGPIEVDNSGFDIRMIMADESLLEAAQKLALAMSAPKPAPVQRILPPGDAYSGR